MKLTDLTKEQRERLEADELGRELIKTDCDKWHCSSYRIRCRKCGTKFEENKQEIKRTIKRIDDEIEFIESKIEIFHEVDKEEIGSKTYQLGWHACTEAINTQFNERLEKLEQQKEIYGLMETLE